MVRKIDLTGETIGTMTAVTELMWQQIIDGTFEDTVLTIDWGDDPASIAVGHNEDADQFDIARTREEGLVVGRSVNLGGGGSGVFTPATPSVLMFYNHDRHDKDKNSLLRHFDELNGQANAAALEQVGLEGEYRSIGDTEVVLEDMRVKVMASAAGSFPHPEYWGILSTPIWNRMPSDIGELFNEVINLPKEKFEDKDTDNLTSRMQPISSVLDDLDKEVTKTEMIDAVVEQNVSRIIGEDEEIVETSWRPAEQEFLERMIPFYESDTWINRLSTKMMCMEAPPGSEVGIAAYKARKLIKTSIILDEDGRVEDAIFTGDFYLRPMNPTVGTSVLDLFTEAVRGEDPTDHAAIESALLTVFNRPEIELPRIEAEDFAQPVVRAADNTQPVDEYLE